MKRIINSTIVVIGLIAILFCYSYDIDNLRSELDNLRTDMNQRNEFLTSVVSGLNSAIRETIITTIDGDNKLNREVRELRAKVPDTLNLSVLNSCGIITNDRSSGSCVAIRPNLILTAGHCISTREIQIEISGRKYKVLKQWRSEQYDIGFVEIDGDLPFVELADVKPQLLDNVYVVGTPLQNEHQNNCVNNITKGIISNINVNWYIWKEGIIVDAAAYPGNSGGPLLCEQSKIIGIMVGCHNRIPEGGDNFWLAEPVEHIRIALEEYDGGY